MRNILAFVQQTGEELFASTSNDVSATCSSEGIFVSNFIFFFSAFFYKPWPSDGTGGARQTNIGYR
jgi:hypothetical protein